MTSILLSRVNAAVAGLTPGYFALVMGSGIISIGLDLEGHPSLSAVLLAICAVAYAVLVVLTAWRILAFGRRIAADLGEPRRAFGFFTLVAGTNVLGVRLSAEGWHVATLVALCVAGTGWLVLGYVIPWTAVLGKAKRPVVAYANGTWFIWVVASQSVAIAAATLEPEYTSARVILSVVAVFSWSVGVFLYVAAGVLVALRMMLYDLRPEDLDPPYWVAMGACAITVLAGSRVVEMADAPMVLATRGLVAGASVAFWAFGTWLIPPLVAAGWWRHVRHRVPLGYEATQWSIVFPLGMYSVAGIYLGRADDLPLVGATGSAWLWVALGVFVIVLVAMCRHLWVTVLTDREAT